MTTKRFNRVGGYVYDENKCISHFEDVTHRDDIVTLLNELYEENEELKQRNKKRLQRLKNQRKQLEKQQEAIWGYKGDIKQLNKENEQLKKDIEYYKTERLALFEYLDKKNDLKLELKVENDYETI